jgi:acetyl esterase/lipase
MADSEADAFERVRYSDQTAQFVDIYRATEPSKGTVVSIHGGYWRARYDLELQASIAQHLVRHGWNVVNTEYRRIEPDGPAVWDEMSSHVLVGFKIAAELPGPLVALGHSAGGQLALWAAAQAASRVQAVIALAPVSNFFLADGLELSDHATRSLFGTTGAERPDLYASASPLHLLPLGCPQLLVHGHADDDVPYDFAVDYLDAAEMSGDPIEFVSPEGLDHFHIIDPAHTVWRTIDAALEDWAETL